jgi:hypothetical protein
MTVGAFALWIGVPAAVLWGLGKIVKDPAEHLVLGLVAIPSGMVLFAMLLAQLNTIYLRVTGFVANSGRDDGGWMPRLQGPLDRILGFCAVIAIVALLAWMVFAPSGPALGP